MHYIDTVALNPRKIPWKYTPGVFSYPSYLLILGISVAKISVET